MVSGDVVAGHYVRAACSRFIRDLENGHDRGLFFDANTAFAYVEFFQKALRHTIGEFAGQPFIPLPWQNFVIANLYGWQMNGRRRFNYAYVSIGRKNGKTTMMAGAALAAALFDQEPAAEVYIAATKRDQAKICFDECKRMAQRSPILAKNITARRAELLIPSLSARVAPLSSESNTLDGLNVHFAGIDEFHAHTTSEVADVLRSGMQSRRNPLHLTISTAGFNIDGPCHRLHKTCREILDGVKSDESQFAMLFELDKGDDWTDSANWEKANPSIGSTISLDALKKQQTQAANLGGSTEVEFKTKHLNLWVASSKTWISAEVWEAGNDPRPVGGNCWAGLDLASVSDLTALILFFPDGSGGGDIRGHYFLPRATIDQTIKDNPGHIYREFQELPNFHVTDGNATNYAAIRKIVTGVHLIGGQISSDPACIMSQYDLQKLAFDRYNSTQIAIDLVDDGAPVVPYGQGFVSLSPPMKQMEIMIRNGQLRHNGDPVLRWAIRNVELKTDPAGNIKADKGKSSGKIDPVVALAMAVGEWMKSDRPLKDSQMQFISL